VAEYEYQRLALPRGTSPDQTRTVLSIAASYGGWELARYRSWPDGTRKVDLRRKVDPRRVGAGLPLPQLSI